MVFVDVELTNRDEVLSFLAHAAKENELIDNETIFTEAVYARENIIATSVGYEIAIPHGKSATVKEPFVAYLRAKEGFVWDEEVHDTVQSIFLIGVPEEDTGMIHLRYISQVSKKLINDAFRETLFQCKHAEEAFTILASINDGIKESRGNMK